MRKLWSDIKSECINLGFDKATAYQKNPSIFIEAANRAIKLIAATVKPILEKITIPHNPTDDSEDWISYDMSTLTEESGKEVFHDFYERPTIDGEPVSEYRKDGRNTILFPSSISGDIDVWYKKYPAPITQATLDSYELEIDYDVSDLVPLLMGFYIWMDDDKNLATIYRNDYEQRRDELMASMTRPLIIIQGGEI